MNSKPRRLAKSPRADVLIIGGGPSGSAAAIICARAGLEVIMMESALFPRDHPGETLHPGIEVLLNRLGLSEEIAQADFLRSDGHYIDSNGHVDFVPYGSDQKGPWLGYHAWRADFDAILLEGARRAGASIWQSCTGRDIVVEDGSIQGANSDRGLVFSRFVVDGSGSAQWLHKQLKLGVRQFSDKLTVKYGYCVGNHKDLKRPTFRIRQHGWAWAAQVRAGIVAWAQLTASKSRATPMLDDLLNGMQPLASSRGANATWRIVPESAGPGYFILGDAAATLDPASSHGVLRAIASGIMAGDQIVQIHAGHADVSVAAALYRSWLSNWFQRDAAQLFEVYCKHSPSLAAAIGRRIPQSILLEADDF